MGFYSSPHADMCCTLGVVYSWARNVTTHTHNTHIYLGNAHTRVSEGPIC